MKRHGLGNMMQVMLKSFVSKKWKELEKPLMVYSAPPTRIITVVIDSCTDLSWLCVSVCHFFWCWQMTPPSPVTSWQLSAAPCGLLPHLLCIEFTCTPVYLGFTAKRWTIILVIVSNGVWMWWFLNKVVQVHLNKLECRGKVHLFQ